MQLLGLEVPPDIKAKYTPEAHALLEPEYTSLCNAMHNPPVNVTSIRINEVEKHIFNDPPGHHESDEEDKTPVDVSIAKSMSLNMISKT